MGVNFRGLGAVVAEGGLYPAYIHPALHQVGGKTVAQRVRSAPWIAPGVLHGFAKYALDACGSVLPPGLALKKPISGLVMLVIRP